jgi:hypothetical protein
MFLISKQNIIKKHKGVAQVHKKYSRNTLSQEEKEDKKKYYEN